MPQITVTTADWADKLDARYRYIFIKGGRSSGKSWEVSNYLCLRSLEERNLKIVGLREIQKSIDKSSKALVDQTLKSMGVDKYYKSIQSEIRKTIKGDSGLFYFQGMNDLTADNIKSLEGFKIAWFEEAQNASHKTLKTLRPTIRTENSQLIFTWNPKLPTDPIDEFCASVQDEPDVLVLHVNYNDNPFLTDSTLREIEIDRNKHNDSFAHVWLGEYDTSFQGHYYAKQLQAARDAGRVCPVPIKTGVDIISAWDLGMRDYTAIWMAQRVGLEWRIIDYYHNNFEDLDHYAQWMRDNGYGKARIFLPHDGAHERLGANGSIRSQLMEMGFDDVDVLSMLKVDSGMALAKTLINECYFDSERCADGLHALSHYHSRYDETKQIYKEVHDWSSHGSDAFRYLAQAIYNKSKPEIRTKRISYRPPRNTSWMG